MPRPPFTKEEIKYIFENMEIKSQSEIAEDLSKIFRENNNAQRTRSGVHNIIQRLRKGEIEK